MPTVSCPSCARSLEVDDAYRDWTVRCPHCATEFVPSEVAPAPFERAPRDRRDDRDRDRDRRDDRERGDRGDDDYDRPRRRRRRESDPERDEREREEAIRLVHGPGTWLEVCGWLGGLLLAGSVVFWLFSASVQANNPNGGDEVTPILMSVVSGLAILPYTIIMVVGGRKMRALSSYGWAMTASVVGIASITLLCSMCVCALVPIGFGIWGVVTLNNPIVSRAFARNRDAPRSWDD